MAASLRGTARGGTYPDIGWSLQSTLLVDDLISGKESDCVGVVLECLNHSEDTREVLDVVGGPGSGLVESAVGQRRVHIKEHVDTGGIEDRGTLVMVGAGGKIVDANRVDLDEI
jgi:hypothetical protein